ncbi:MAG: hypothetical protein WDZ76_04035 [Pseudohongiellaceae bacterium]
MLNFFLAIMVAAILTACAVPEDGDERSRPRLPTDAEVEQHNAQVPPEERIICRDETKIGTNIPRRVCRYIRDVEETSDFHREQLRRAL